MAYALDERLVVAIASSALFDLSASDAVWQAEGEEAYRAYQLTHLDDPYAKGIAFDFIENLLGLNALNPDNPVVEVVLLSRNSHETGLRVMRSLAHHRMPQIERAAFLKGADPWPYLKALHAELFLSGNARDVRAAIAAGYAAGQVLPGAAAHKASEKPLKIAFDFDGVLADDASERVYKDQGLEGFYTHERSNRYQPLDPGPLAPFFRRIAEIQLLDRAEGGHFLRTAVVTARGLPAHERVLSTLKNWGVRVDETFFLGGVEKADILATFNPQIYFDDQMGHLDKTRTHLPSVLIPFGVRNQPG